jgi:hypothetical protein
LAGFAFHPVEAVTFHETNPSFVYLYLSERTGMCDAIRANQTLGNSGRMEFIFYNRESGGFIDPDVGTYSVRFEQSNLPLTARLVWLQFLKLDSSCNNLGGAMGTGGSVEVTQLGSATGDTTLATMDAQFGNDHIKGPLKAIDCELSPASQMPPVSCQ